MRRISGINVLEESDIRAACPSFYAEAPKHDVSDGYQFINTREVAKNLWSEGWMPTDVQESKSKDPSNRGLTKHIIRWTHHEWKRMSTGADRIEIVGINAHNRAAAFKLMIGVFGTICSNGLFVQMANYGEFSIRHSGSSVQEQVKLATKEIAASAEDVMKRIEQFREIEFLEPDQQKFARVAHALVWGDKDHAPIDSHHLLRPRREVEQSPYNLRRPLENLWTTMNVVQENVMRGGIRGTNAAGAFYRTKPITSIDRTVNFNQALWSVTETMANIKLAA